MRALLPREHGLWCWVSAPLFAALLLRPSLGVAGGAMAIFAVFLAGNAARAGRWGLALLPALAAAGLAGLVVPRLVAPVLLVGPLAALTLGGLALVLGASRLGRHLGLELLVVLGYAAAGAGLAAADGASAPSLLAFAALASFEVVGLWWVRGQLARVLPGRVPWQPAIPAALTVLTVLGGLLLGAPVTGAVPLLYGLRVATTRAVTSPRDARRIGLSEAGWAAVAAAVAVLGVR